MIYKTVTTGVFFAFGTLLTAWGLSGLEWSSALPWSGFSALGRYLSVLLFSLVIVGGFSLFGRRDPVVVGGLLALFVAVCTASLWSFIVLITFFVSAAVLGRIVRIKLNDSSAMMGWIVNILVGAGIYGVLIGLMAHFPINYPGVYGLLLLMPLVLFKVHTCELISAVRNYVREKHRKKRPELLLEIAIVVVGLVYFVVALMPEVGHDALAMHLFIPGHLEQQHLWGFDVSKYVWAVMPMLGDWIFSAGYMLAGETSTRLINVGFIFILVGLVREFVIWAGGTDHGAKWAMLIFLSTPLTFTESSSLFIEPIWASFLVAGILGVLQACSKSCGLVMPLKTTAILLGLALSAKAVTLSILPILLLVFLLCFRRWAFKGGMLSDLVIGILLFLAIGVIPYITAWWITGNPVFPFFNAVFQSDFFPNVNFDSSTIFGKGLSWDFLYQVTFESGKFLEARPGASGFQWLLLLLPSLIILTFTKHLRGIGILAIGFLIILIVFQSVSYLRYVFPAWILLTAGIGIAISELGNKKSFIATYSYFVAAVAIVLNLLFLNAGAQYSDFALKSLISKTDRESYLHYRLPIRNAVKLVNKLNIGGTPVAVFSQPLTAGLAADALYASWYNYKFKEAVMSAFDKQAMANTLMNEGVDYVILDSNWGELGKRELIEGATDKVFDIGSISVRVLSGDYRFTSELLRSPDFFTEDGWQFVAGAKHDAKEGHVTVTVSSVGVQTAQVSSGRRYLNAVVAKCGSTPSQGRIQINWLDSHSQIVHVDIKVFDCDSQWTKHTMEVVAPKDAVLAVVYVAGHSSVPLVFKSNSLLQ